jgi:hypothetical protein
MRLEEPIDALHRECMYAVRDIREHVSYIREEISKWEPRPLPDKRLSD